ncbi:hypothetical protein PSTG_00992 [Puccinia striiformis f. sp. tritici PST-78]|uniref:Uncharacterized protein n=1 Tax=Puccinia striiformis f. sp. tritici PST-78 TaxID=1165861 RepID=A0A0L0W420_9BASI|nr:hypothetical protein PSTG_00992 [Puccinia striiformis f. sp. tritici PST-78]
MYALRETNRANSTANKDPPGRLVRCRTNNLVNIVRHGIGIDGLMPCQMGLFNMVLNKPVLFSAPAGKRPLVRLVQHGIGQVRSDMESGNKSNTMSDQQGCPTWHWDQCANAMLTGLSNMALGPYVQCCIGQGQQMYIFEWCAEINKDHKQKL